MVGAVSLMETVWLDEAALPCESVQVRQNCPGTDFKMAAGLKILTISFVHVEIICTSGIN